VALGLIELILVFGLAAAFVVWQLWDLKRYDKGGAKHGSDKDTPNDKP
jgi:hypothetical protein